MNQMILLEVSLLESRFGNIATAVVAEMMETQIS